MMLITGGAGFFGRHLSEALMGCGRKVRILDVQEIDDPVFRRRVEFIKGDVRDRAAVKRAMQEVKIVYHNAAVLPIAKAGEKYFEINVGGTQTVLETAKECGVQKVIYISSSAVYGVPRELPLTENSPFAPFETYGRSKREAEKICEKVRREGLNISILRPRTIVGPGRLGIFSILFDWLRDGKKIYLFGKGDNLFQFLDSRDLTEACLLLEEEGHFEDFNVGAKEYGTYREAIETLIDRARTGSRIVSLNARFGRLSLRLLDRLRLSPLVPWHYETIDKPFYFDTAKAERLLGWRPRHGNNRMLVDNYEWFLKNRQTAGVKFGLTHNKLLKQYALKILKYIS
ncbi:MAG: NAD-dependent epimerase/dehydratase family protein [Deltaproteobacteria bacterium]|nr:NAD-dependent epimerase/dehydratase family protein [Deltaproteobacteria bacterium]